MAQPTFIDYQQSTFGDSGLTDESAASISWQAGDVVLVFGAVSSNEAANLLSTPTVAGLTFSLSTSVNNAAGTDDAQVFLWTATAAGSGSGSIGAVTNTGNNLLRSGLSVFVYRNVSGLGTPVVLDGSAAKTINLTRAAANSHVAVMLVDWNQVNDVVVDATPTGTVVLASAQSGQADFFACRFGDQGAAGGPTAYGITNHTGTVRMSGIVIEIKGPAGPTLSAPTPSGTIGTHFGATIGATTDQTAGTFYVVVDAPTSFAGITAAEIKAGQKAGGAAALSSANSAVSSSSPSAPVTGLAPATTYRYAAVQDNSGDSNIVIGTFTTADGPPTIALLQRQTIFVNNEVIQS